MAWLLFAVMYPFLYALVNVLDKFLLEKRIKNYYSYGVIVGFIGLTTAFIVWMLIGMPKVWPFSVWAVAFLAGVAYGVSLFIYYHLFSYEKSEATRIVGIVYIFPAFVAVISRIFLGEQLTLIKYLAIMIAIVGAVLLGIEKTKKRFKLTHAFWLMILGAFVLAIVDVSNKYVVENIPYWETFVLLSIFTSSVLITPIASKQVRRNLATTTKSLPIILLAQSCSIGAALAFLAAAARTQIAIVSAMGTLQPVFVFAIVLLSSIFAPRLLKEVITPGVIAYKLLGIACVVTGAIVLSL